MAPSPVILDTNVLLDIFVFRDDRSLPLQQMIQNQERQLIYCQAMHDEFIDVLTRSQFQLSQSHQEAILHQWLNLANQVTLTESAPLRCSDPDDQIFIDLAYQTRPSLLVSKDNALIMLRKRLADLNIDLQTY